jgi:hypothetical protein
MCLGVRRRVPPDTGIIQVNRVFCLYDDQVFFELSRNRTYIRDLEGPCPIR